MTREAAGFSVRPARSEDLAAARAIMLRTFDEDFGYGYQPRFHKDVDDLKGTYLEDPRHTLFVAVDDGTAQVLGTAGIKVGGPRPHLHPQWLVERYDRVRTAELVRVYVLKEHRKRGIGHALVDAARGWMAAREDYTTLYLHTDASYPGALEFWTSHAKIVYDGRGKGEPSKALHFEIPIGAREVERVG